MDGLDGWEGKGKRSHRVITLVKELGYLSFSRLQPQLKLVEFRSHFASGSGSHQSRMTGMVAMTGVTGMTEVIRVTGIRRMPRMPRMPRICLQR